MRQGAAVAASVASEAAASVASAAAWWTHFPYRRLDGGALHSTISAIRARLLSCRVFGILRQANHVTVRGGLPALPGTNITMPVLNGHAVSEQLLTAPTDVVPADPAENEFTPGELKASGPHPLQKHHFEADEPGKNSGNGQDSDPVT
jgi:hypothetical protein